MLFHVRMDVHLPADLDPQTAAELVGREKAYSQELQRKGKWPHIWRIVGEYANFSIFDVESNDELHQMLSRLTAVPVHGHSRDAAGHASVRRERLAELGHPLRRMCVTSPTVVVLTRFSS